MSGEPQRDDDPDFLDDFIIEDDAGAKDADLDELFEEPATSPGAKTPAQKAGAAQDAAFGSEADGSAELDDAAFDIPEQPAGNTDGIGSAEESVLFTDHTEFVDEPSAKFESGRGFDENASSTWRGDELELDEAGVPEDGEEGTSVERGAEAASVGDAEASFTAELDSLLQSEDEFAIDSEKELELVESDSLLGSEDEGADTFVLDDGGGAWQEDAEDVVQVDDNGEAAPEAQTADAETEAEFEQLETAAELETVEAGWEPLPGAHMDELAEVDEVGRAEIEEEQHEAEEQAVAAQPLPGFARPALVGAGADTEGHDLYADSAPSGPTGLVGAPRRQGRTLRLVASIAASLAIVAAGAIIVVRPDWFGLRFEPEMVQNVQVERPRVVVPVPTPPMPEVAAVTPTPKDPVQSPTQPVPTNPVEVPVVPTPDVKVSAVTPDVTTTPAVPTETAPTTPSVPVAVVPVPSPTDSWPVAGGHLAQSPGASSGLVRIGTNLMVGRDDPAQAKPVDGMLPGSRAFAQLHNGNFFIGSVKYSDKERLTLRIGTGEVTLQVASIAKLHELGSADYDELQKVTSGFVRLTNNNRLVGRILSDIADDHVVLEFRSNRVMLPKTAIGEVVQGQDESGVRIDTTREEDDWLRRLAERQLGTGTAPVDTKDSAQPPAGARGKR